MAFIKYYIFTLHWIVSSLAKCIFVLCIISACCAAPFPKPSNSFKLPASKYQLNVRDGRGANQLQSRQLNDESHYTQQEGLTKDGYAKIINHDLKTHHNGDYQYIYSTDNGISAYEVGKLKIFSDEDAGSEVQGEYSYTAPDGQLIRVQYIANEFGFQPVGAHIPTPPPLPPHVVKQLADLEKAQQAADKSGKRI